MYRKTCKNDAGACGVAYDKREVHRRILQQTRNMFRRIGRVKAQAYDAHNNGETYVYPETGYGLSRRGKLVRLDHV